MTQLAYQNIKFLEFYLYITFEASMPICFRVILNTHINELKVQTRALMHLSRDTLIVHPGNQYRKGMCSLLCKVWEV